MEITRYTYIEIGSAGFSIIYSLLLMREKKIGWLFGILSSILGVFLFVESKIYAQAIISIYYAGIGIYGWLYWKKAEQRNEHISVWNRNQHLIFISIFTILSVASAYLFKTFTDSRSPVLDSFLTIFGFLASIKEARKILTSWVYWFVINGFSVWLYFDQQLYIYSILMVVYAGICIAGYLNWERIYKTNNITSV